MHVEPIAHISTDFPTKFGIPRQSGLVPQATGIIVFEPAYRNPDALRGIDDFSHLWLIWGFSENIRETWTPLVRPPRLGGNERLGVFATRSPFRPNNLGLSSVELVGMTEVPGKGTVLEVRGVDLMDGTPIYDIKPYIPYTDSHPDAQGGFAADPDEGLLEVDCPDRFSELLGSQAPALLAVLARDPRPAYHDDPDRVYGMTFGDFDVRFRVADGVLQVVEISHA